MAKEVKIAYAITKSKTGKSYWYKVGVAFVNNDGSENVELFAIPVDGKFQIREQKEWDNDAPKQQTRKHKPSDDRDADQSPDNNGGSDPRSDFGGGDDIPF